MAAHPARAIMCLKTSVLCHFIDESILMQNLKIQEKEWSGGGSLLPIAVEQYLLRHWDLKKPNK